MLGNLVTCKCKAYLNHYLQLAEINLIFILIALVVDFKYAQNNGCTEACINTCSVSKHLLLSAFY